MSLVPGLLLPLLLASLLPGCTVRNQRLEAERARMEAAFEQLGALESAEGGAGEIPGLSAAPPDGLEERPRPEWAGVGVSTAYPLRLYLTGVGSAERGKGNAYKALAAAEERARADLARNISVRIQVEFDNTARLVTESSSGAAAVLKDSSATAERIRSQTDEVLKGSHIVDRWYDPQCGTYWALAALERAVAAAAVQDQMALALKQSAVDRDMGRAFAAEGKRVQAAGAFQRAARGVYTLLDLRARLNAIAPDSLRAQPLEELPVADTLKDAAGSLEQLRVKMAVFVRAEDAEVSPEDAESLLVAALRRNGLNVAPLKPAVQATYDELAAQPVAKLREWAGEDTDILLIARLAARQAAHPQTGQVTLYFYQAKGNAVAYNLGADRLLASAGFDLLPESHSAGADRQRAAAAALHEAAVALAERIRTGIVDALGMSKE